MKRLLLISTCLFITSPAFAQQASMQSPAYRECSTLANSNPTQALAKADTWLKMDTGIAAQHCRAMALYGLRRFAEAGDALTAVRDMIAPENITLRSYVARQAANAMVGANKADQAVSLLTTQINEISTMRTDNGIAAGVTSELLVERARIHTNFGKLDDAAKDLDHAVSLTPTNESVLMERSAVFEKLGDFALAKNDLKSVLTINSSHNAARVALSRLNGGAPMNFTPTQTAAPVAATAPQASAVPEKPAVATPAKRTKKKKSVKKATTTPQAKAAVAPVAATEPVAAAAKAPTLPTAAPAPIAAAPVATPALPPVAAPVAPKPAAAVPALPPVAAPAGMGMPALPKP